MKEIALIGSNGPVMSAVLGSLLAKGLSVEVFSLYPEHVMIDNTQLTVRHYDYASEENMRRSLEGYSTVVIANETDLENEELDNVILKYFPSTLKAIAEAGIENLVVVGAKESNAFYLGHLKQLENTDWKYYDTEGDYASRVIEALKVEA